MVISKPSFLGALIIPIYLTEKSHPFIFIGVFLVRVEFAQMHLHLGAHLVANPPCWGFLGRGGGWGP